MSDPNSTASSLFGNAHRLIEAYHRVLQPFCRETGLPPMAVDILLFIANNPDSNTAKDICSCRGFKAGIVSVHIERLVSEGLLIRRSAPDDRRMTRLVCSDAVRPLIERGREIQKSFACRISEGLTEDDREHFKKCLDVLSRNIDNIRNSGI